MRAPARLLPGSSCSRDSRRWVSGCRFGCRSARAGAYRSATSNPWWLPRTGAGTGTACWPFRHRPSCQRHGRWRYPRPRLPLRRRSGSGTHECARTARDRAVLGRGCATGAGVSRRPCKNHTKYIATHGSRATNTCRPLLKVRAKTHFVLHSAPGVSGQHVGQHRLIARSRRRGGRETAALTTADSTQGTVALLPGQPEASRGVG
jgi:hypothetical protein